MSDRLVIYGGCPLSGTVKISGAKNAALPIMIASLLCSEKTTITNLPHLRDVTTTLELLGIMGVDITLHQTMDVILDANNVTSYTAPEYLVNQMRASILVLGPLLARYGQAKVAFPGGCAIGKRPIDQHIKGLEALGVTFDISNQQARYIVAKAKKGLKGAYFSFEKKTVGGTENMMIAAVTAKGRTVLDNAAREPEVCDLAYFLNTMGAKISGIGTDKIEIEGVDALGGGKYRIMPDRIETGTYLVAAAATQGQIRLTRTAPKNMTIVLDKLKEAGTNIHWDDNTIDIDMRDRVLRPVNITTSPYPGFPTDMQAQFTVLNAIAHGRSTVNETIFENRLIQTHEIKRMGANIAIDKSRVHIYGPNKLKGAAVTATDLRASASLVIAGLIAEGKTVIDSIHHIDRGYEFIEEKMQLIGGNIRRQPVMAN